MATATQDETKFRVCVGPSIFRDGTFGVFLVPQDGSELEYTLCNRYSTSNEATANAERLVSNEIDPSGLIDSEIEVLSERRFDLDIFEECEDEARLKDTIKNREIITQISSKFTDPMWWLRQAGMAAPTIAIASLFFFGLGKVFTFPSASPVVGDFVGGLSLGPPELARGLAPVLLFLVGLRWYRARQWCDDQTATIDAVICLAIRHHWRRQDFHDLYQEVWPTPFWAKSVAPPDAPASVNQKAGNRVDRQSVDTQRVLDSDFERRVHALYFMRKQTDFKPRYMVTAWHGFLSNVSRPTAVLRAIGNDEADRDWHSADRLVVLKEADLLKADGFTDVRPGLARSFMWRRSTSRGMLIGTVFSDVVVVLAAVIWSLVLIGSASPVLAVVYGIVGLLAVGARLRHAWLLLVKRLWLPPGFFPVDLGQQGMQLG